MKRWFYNSENKQVACANESGEIVDVETGAAVITTGEWWEFNDDPRHYNEATLAATHRVLEVANVKV